MNYDNFNWISTTGYIPVTLWKWQLDQNPISRLPELCNVRVWHRDIGETTVRNADDWYKLLQIIENLSSCTSRCICDLLGMREVERSYPRPPDGRQFYRLCLRGLCYHDKDASRYKSGLWSSLSGEQAAKRWCGYFCTACITKSGLSYSPKIVICHIKEITAIVCHLLPILE